MDFELLKTFLLGCLVTLNVTIYLAFKISTALDQKDFWYFQRGKQCRLAYRTQNKSVLKFTIKSRANVKHLYILQWYFLAIKTWPCSYFAYFWDFLRVLIEVKDFQTCSIPLTLELFLFYELDLYLSDH